MASDTDGARAGLMRRREGHGHHRVTNAELFFDLVFVFAVTQISHFLLAHFSAVGAVEAAMLMLAVWWVWVFTSWATNWLDPDQTTVRVMLFVLMVVGLLLSTSIPGAFAQRGLAFAIAFVVMQVGRTAFFAWAVPASQDALRSNFLRILVWLMVSGVFWIAGGLVDGSARLALWGIALAIEYCGPVSFFYVPGLGASTTSDWDVEGGHMAERCSLFIIIALGESIVVTGATFTEATWTLATSAAFVAATVGSIAMWWIYFHLGAEAGAERITGDKDPGRLARLSYTYLHLPIVAGIVVAAVGDELALAHPDGHTDIKAIATLIGGPLLFLIGMLLFKYSVRQLWQLSHIAGIAALLLLIPFGHDLSPLWLSAATTLVLLVVATWEARSLGGQGAEG